MSIASPAYGIETVDGEAAQVIAARHNRPYETGANLQQCCGRISDEISLGYFEIDEFYTER